LIVYRIRIKVSLTARVITTVKVRQIVVEDEYRFWVFTIRTNRIVRPRVKQASRLNGCSLGQGENAH
jgi:hypothetical protein